MSRRDPFLVTLYSGGATQEMAYGRDACGYIRLVEASDWDFPVEKPVESALVEVFVAGRKVKELRLSGEKYLYLAAADAMDDLLAALDRLPPAEALDYAQTMARLNV